MIITAQSLQCMACNAAYMHAVMFSDLGLLNCMQGAVIDGMGASEMLLKLP